MASTGGGTGEEAGDGDAAESIIPNDLAIRRRRLELNASPLEEWHHACAFPIETVRLQTIPIRSDPAPGVDAPRVSSERDGEPRGGET